MMRKIISILLLISFKSVIAQNSDFLDNRHELGLELGGSNYIGDMGSRNLIWPNGLSGGGYYRFNFNRRLSVRLNFNYALVRGNDLNSNIDYRKARGLRFTNDFFDGSVVFDYNFFKYDLESSNAFTPYVFVGFGLDFYKQLQVDIVHVPNAFTDVTLPKEFDTFIYKNYSNTSGYHIPFGLGVKKKISYRLNLSAAVRFNYLLSDGIDYSNLTSDNFSFDRTSLPESEFTDEIVRRNNNVTNRLIYGNPDNNDWVVYTQIGISYSFGRGKCYCEEDFFRGVKRRSKRVF